jgi:hypothetical protein
VRAADARVLDLLVIAPIVDRDDVEGLPHASSHRTARGSPEARERWSVLPAVSRLLVVLDLDAAEDGERVDPEPGGVVGE